MKILSLNCQGLGQPEAVRDLRCLIELHCPTVVFLSETRLFSDKVDGLRRSLGFANGLGVGSFGRGGGLALLWKDDLVVSLQTLDKMHIDVAILDPVSRMEKWRFTGFYGESRRDFRYRSWDCLKLLNTHSRLPWLCVGDFNETLSSSEHFGGTGRTEAQMEGFREAVSICRFSDLGFIGLPYTWDNRREGDQNVKARLDRGLATDTFLDIYREVKVWNVQTTISDHSCLVVEYLNHTNRRRKKKNFRYENMWQRDPSYMALIRDT